MLVFTSNIRSVLGAMTINVSLVKRLEYTFSLQIQSSVNLSVSESIERIIFLDDHVYQISLRAVNNDFYECKVLNVVNDTV